MNTLGYAPVTIEVEAVVRNGTWEQARHVSFPKGMKLTEGFINEYHASATEYPILLKWLLTAKWYHPGVTSLAIVDGRNLHPNFTPGLWGDRVLIADSIPFPHHRNAHITLTEAGISVVYDKSAALEVAKGNVASEEMGRGFSQLNIPISGYSWEDHYKKHGESAVPYNAAYFWDKFEKWSKVMSKVSALAPKKETVSKVFPLWKYVGYTWRVLECLIVFSCWGIMGKIIASHIK